MDDFSLEMKSIKVILKDDINKIRQFIKLKYPDYDNRKRAAILANTIHKIIDDTLFSYPEGYRPQIRKHILEGQFLSSSEGLFMYDIFEASLTLNLSDEEFINGLCNWANNHLSTPLNKAIILDYTNSKKTYSTNQPKATGEDLPIPHQITLENNGEIKEIRTNLLKYILSNKLTTACSILLLVSITTVLTYRLNNQSVIADSLNGGPTVEATASHLYPHLPFDFHYKEIHVEGLLNYLNTRNSILADEPYFSSILETSVEFQLNPLVLFAIAGHEQGFVPRDHPQAEKIANNPYNVFNSWQKYNTDIIDSTRIAARTIINSSMERPEDVDPFKWINRRYAEDEDWWRGVSSIFNRLEKEAYRLPEGGL